MKTNRKSALIAGIALIIMAVAAGFTYGYIHNTLVIANDPESTFNNLKLNGLLFQTEIYGWLLILILDVVVAWSLYVFFKNENKKLSALTAGFRLVYSAILGMAILNLIQILNILNGTFPETAGDQMLFHLNSFENTWSFGLIIFGFHLLLLGILALQSKYIPNFWGILLVFAAVSYSLIHSAKFLFLEFETYIATAEMILSLPMAFGEVGFAFWLIIRGGKSRVVYRQIKAAVIS
jgi:hypothetical protein